MHVRRFPPRPVLWAFAAVLLLNAAMPLLASVAARWQDKALAEVCTVYGIVAVAQAPGEDGPADSHPAATDGGSHCLLASLPAWGTAGAMCERQVQAAPPPQSAPAGDVARPLHDAVAQWVARLEHGPPAVA